ncbi:MAG: hypothetical protein HY553_03710, partial [Elusimicrobia bacterium]|nr:hypothetical protein [Elusimicrobiota bacterium]
MNERELLDELCGRLGTGGLDSGFVLQAIRELSRGVPVRRSTSELLEALNARPGGAYAGLAAHVRARRFDEARRCHLRRRAGGDAGEFTEVLADLPAGLPLGWVTVKEAAARLRCAAEGVDGGAPLEDAVARLIDPVALVDKLLARQESAPIRRHLVALRGTLEGAVSRAAQEAGRYVRAEAPAPPAGLLASDAVSVIRRALESGTPQDRRRAVELACAWPTSGLAQFLRELGERHPDARETIMLAMAVRHNEPAVYDWHACAQWLERAAAQDKAPYEELAAIESAKPAELLLAWMRDRKLLWPSGAREALRAWCTAKPEAAVVERTAPAPAFIPPPRAPEQPAHVQIPEQNPPAPDEPSFWDEHMMPFLAGNWPMLTGIAMVVVGSSLLAYYTWDKHWLARYTLLPLLLGSFTGGLGRLAGWMEGRERRLKSAANMLRGASIALLPANFMAVALLAQDPGVPAKAVLFPLYAAIYLAFAGRGLSRWCAAADPSLGGLLPRTLLALNALVLLGPLCQGRPLVLAAGFYAGFAVAAHAVVRFLGGLTPQMIEQERVPWFFAVVLTTTYAQVFLWVHGFLRHVPAPETYACLAILAGALVMFTERSPLIRRKDDPVYGTNSFLGYACVLLGLLLGASHPQTRTLSLVLAGAVWLAQAAARADALHAWIAFGLLAAGGGSIALWADFPAAAAPALLLAVAAAMEIVGRGSKGWWRGLESVGAGTQAAALQAAAVLAVALQWRAHTEPLLTAGLLATAAAGLARRASLDDKLAHLHAAAVTAAFVLPYAGFADMSGRALYGNTLVFGLGVLSLAWLAVTRAAPAPLVLSARSSVLLLYGVFACAAIVVRLGFEEARPHDLQAWQSAMSLTGPPLIALTLTAAALFSRSWLPIGLASVIGVILLPELKAEIRSWLPFFEWGSGLGSATAALALVGSCFRLRTAHWLAEASG